MNSFALKLTTALFGALLMVTLSGLVAYTSDNENPLTISKHDVVMGDDAAPLTVIEYASMTCSHCADFHNNVFPKLKKNYIDTGKINFVLRDMPWDPLALAVSKITRCAPDGQFYKFTSAFFETQKTWVQSDDPIEALKKTARLGGMDGARVEECLSDAAVHTRVTQSREMGLETLGVKSTPTFFIGDDEVVPGNVGYEKMANFLDKVLKRAE